MTIFHPSSLIKWQVLHYQSHSDIQRYDDEWKSRVSAFSSFFFLTVLPYQTASVVFCTLSAPLTTLRWKVTSVSLLKVSSGYITWRHMAGIEAWKTHTSHTVDDEIYTRFWVFWGWIFYSSSQCFAQFIKPILFLLLIYSLFCSFFRSFSPRRCRSDVQQIPAISGNGFGCIKITPRQHTVIHRLCLDAVNVPGWSTR